jgi:hypothetical protein
MVLISTSEYRIFRMNTAADIFAAIFAQVTISGVLLLALVAALLWPLLVTADGAVPESGQATPLAPAGRASLAITSLEPLTVTGRGFKAGEQVTVRFESRRKVTTATGAGRLVVRFAAVYCTGGTIVAVGSKGSRAVANYSRLLCVAP